MKRSTVPFRGAAQAASPESIPAANNADSEKWIPGFSLALGPAMTR
jgi:hypothetical protein